MSSSSPAPSSADPTPPAGGAPAAADPGVAEPQAESATAPTGAPGSALSAVFAHPLAFLPVLKNRPLDALRLGHAQGNGWWLQFALLTFVAALNGTVLVGRSGQIGMGMLSSVTGLGGLGSYFYKTPYWMLDAGEGFGLFFLLLLVFAVLHLARVALLHMAFAVGKAGQPFAASGQIVMTAYSGHLWAMGLGTLLFLIPGSGMGSLVLFVGALVLSVLGVGAEILMYLGLNRLHRFAGSPYLPYLGGYAAWLVVVGVLMYVLGSMMESM